MVYLCTAHVFSAATVYFSKRLFVAWFHVQIYACNIKGYYMVFNTGSVQILSEVCLLCMHNMPA